MAVFNLTSMVLFSAAVTFSGAAGCNGDGVDAGCHVGEVPVDAQDIRQSSVYGPKADSSARSG